MQLDDFKWYAENYTTLCETFGDSFVVIKDRQVLGVFDNVSEAVRQTRKIEPLGTFIVQECRSDKCFPACHISSPSLGV